MNYADILKDLKKRMKPVELGVTVQGIKEKRIKDLLVELKYSKEDRGRLKSAFKEVIGAGGSTGHLIPKIEVEITDIDLSTDAEDVEEAVRKIRKICYKI